MAHGPFHQDFCKGAVNPKYRYVRIYMYSRRAVVRGGPQQRRWWQRQFHRPKKAINLENVIASYRLVWGGCAGGALLRIGVLPSIGALNIQSHHHRHITADRLSRGRCRAQISILLYSLHCLSLACCLFIPVKTNPSVSSYILDNLPRCCIHI